MAKDDTTSPRDPEGRRRGSETGPRDAASRGSSLPRRGRSGYGMESIRPHLRAQLAEQKLWRPTFPPESEEEVARSRQKARGKDR